MLGSTTLVEWLGQNLAELMPYKVIRTYQRGVRFTRGTQPRALMPGWHWFLPVVQSIEILTVSQDSINLPTQTIITRDQKQLTFSGVVLYEITDPVAYWCHVQDATNTMRDKAMLFLARRFRRCTLEQATRMQRRTERVLRARLTDDARAWGLLVVDVGLTDFSTARPFRLYGDSPALL